MPTPLRVAFGFGRKPGKPRDRPRQPDRVRLQGKHHRVRACGLEERNSMQLGMIGLGRMGSNMVRRLMKAGHECAVFDRSAKAVDDLAREKAVGSSSLADL